MLPNVAGPASVLGRVRNNRTHQAETSALLTGGGRQTQRGRIFLGCENKMSSGSFGPSSSTHWGSASTLQMKPQVDFIG